MNADSLITEAAVVTRHGASGVLELTSVQLADPGPEQLLVQVAAAGLNFKDVYLRQGVYPSSPPYVLGTEGAGTVVAAGAAVTDFASGDVVCWARGDGSAAGLALVTAADAVPVPDSVSAEVAAAVMLQGMTAHFLVNDCYPVSDGDWVVVHAAAGGVGQLLVQLARARGGKVIAVVSTQAKAETAAALGAFQVLVDPVDLAASVRQLTGGSGAHVVYDGVGLATFDASLASIRPRGMMVLFGAASGAVPPVDLQRLNRSGSLFVTRPTLDHYTATRTELLTRAGAVLAAVADGSLRVAIGGRYPLAEAGKAFDDLEGRRTSGKLLLIP